jgi:hypothetical protein
MDWTTLGALGEIAGAIAVFATLLYLTQQVRQANRHDLLSAYQHTYDALNGWCVSVYGSADIASLVLRGRVSYESLDETERFRFDHVHIHLLDIIEAHLYQVRHTSMDDEYRNWAIRNMELIAQGYLGHPGTRQLWERNKDFYEPQVRELISRSIGVNTPSSSTVLAAS